MKKLEFKTDINASAKKVWETMLNPGTFKEWISASYPGSFFKGQWKQGENIQFLSAENAGTLANLVEVRPYEYILAKHTAVINPDGTEDRNSEQAKGWIGTTEAYTFTERNGKTEVKVEVNTNPEWEKMFTEGWPKGLKKLKEITERSKVGATGV
jgi:uncharacterized protein YndB with AHSA1/START domain